jgi:hypothetical protein
MTDRQIALSRGAFDVWPDELRAWFDGTHLTDKASFAASLVTVDAGGWARTSLLSIGELVAADAQSLSFALWPESRAVRSLAQGGAASLAFVFDGRFYQVQLRVVPPRTATQGTALAVFDASVESAEWQRVGYARLTSGVTFELDDDAKTAVLARWDAQVREMLARR